MKFFNDHTGAEVETISDADVSKLIDLECANEGAPMLPSYPEEPIKPDHKPDVTLYKVGGHYGWYTKTTEEASKILEAVNSVKLWDTTYAGSDYGNKRAMRKDSYGINEIATEQCFSPELWDQIKGEIEIYNSKKKKFDADKKEYNASEKARNEISENIWEIVNAAREFKRVREYIVENRKKYIDLADGDESMGDTFFEKAYPHADKYLGKSYSNSQLEDKTISEGDA